ncbi:unnamed protein product [Camellia sinensis]
MVFTQGKSITPSPVKSFKFQAAWVTHTGFRRLVEEQWLPTNPYHLLDNLHSLALSATDWNRNVFGNIFRKKRWLLGRINGIQPAQAVHYSHNLHSLENQLIEKFNEVLYQEELLWFQKSRSNWITQGERNTKFFHLSTIIRRRKSKIDVLKNNDGVWVDNSTELKALVNEYFKNLFFYTPTTAFSHWNNLSRHLTTEDNLDLVRNITPEEVWKAVKNIQAFKAPGKDGFQAFFYHTYWDIVGGSVFELVRNCFSTRIIPLDINRTLIALIPKVDNPESIKQFRPISLCNVTYKIITKILVSRLRPLLNGIISPNQSSFIPGRSTSDNIIITQEAIHTVRKLKGKAGYMIFKIDLEKAYDNISWEFLEQTLFEFNFDCKFIEMVMNCVTNLSTAILWNGEPLEEFKPSKGLRQGDPLSPYLFVLCMERLSNMINHRVEAKDWRGLPLSKKGPNISHFFFFADDLMFFAKADVVNCQTILEVLNEFSMLSGLRVNLTKSKLFVSPNVDRRKAKDLSHICGIGLTQNLGKFLGVPLLHSRVNKHHFIPILERMQQKFAGWKTGVLSLAGRATLIQLVTNAIPAYTMQTLELPRKVCDEIDKLNRNFLWGDSLERKKVHLVNWQQVCHKKKNGGLGIRRARDQNLALLSKLGWKLLNKEEGLWLEVLRNKYLGN